MRISIQSIIWTLVLIAIVVASILAFTPKPVDVEIAVVEQGVLENFVREDGKTRIREKYVISAPVAGRLARIEYKPGDGLDEKGAVVAVIMPAEPALLDSRAKAQAQARVEQAQAALERAKAQQEQVKASFGLSEADYLRAKQLIQDKAISASEFDRAKASFLADSQAIRTSSFDARIAEFELQMAEAALTQFSEDNVQPFEVTTPISGSVLRIFQESATVVNVGTPLIEVGDPHNLEIEIDVLSTDAVKIRPLAEMTIEHWGGESPLMASVRVVEPAAFTKVSSLGVEEQRVNVIADFLESEGRIESLGDGYRVEARIKIDEVPDAVKVSNSALFRHERQWHVFKVIENAAVLQPVSIGLQSETDTEILEGLELGDQVILYPSDEIADGTPVAGVD